MVLPPFLVNRLVGVQARLKKHAPHAVFVHCHLLQLACVQAANSMTENNMSNHADPLWKYFHYSRAESLKKSNMFLIYQK